MSTTNMTFPYPECDPGTFLRENKRYFGEFKCDSCARWWKSGNSWLGFGQDCTGCGELTFPWKLSYLQVTSTSKDGVEKAHPQYACERCISLGYYCRESDGVPIRTNQTGSSASRWPDVYSPDSWNQNNSSLYFNSESKQVLRQRTRQTESFSTITPQARSYSASSSSYGTDFPPLGGNSVNVTANSTVNYESTTRAYQSSRTNSIRATNFNSNYNNYYIIPDDDDSPPKLTELLIVIVVIIWFTEMFGYAIYRFYHDEFCMSILFKANGAIIRVTQNIMRSPYTIIKSALSTFYLGYLNLFLNAGSIFEEKYSQNY